MLRTLLTEFAIFDLPPPEDEDDTAGMGLEQDDDVIDFSTGDGTLGGPEAGMEGGEEDELECECNCPSHKKFDAQGGLDLDADGVDGDKNIEIVDGAPEGEEEEFSLDDEDENDDTDDDSQFNFF